MEKLGFIFKLHTQENIFDTLKRIFSKLHVYCQNGAKKSSKYTKENLIN